MRFTTKAILLTASAIAMAVGLSGCVSESRAAAPTPKKSMSSNGLYLVKSAPTPAKTQMATFAAGCFWGVEDYFRHEPGVVATAAGFSGGHVANPTYLEVCKGTTGHAESVEVEFDPVKTSYEKLVKLFFEIHDPVEPIGHQSKQSKGFQSSGRSMIFYRNPEQQKEALQTIAALEKSPDFKGEKIVTEVVPAGPFYKATEDHQQYIEKGGKAVCHPRKERLQ